MEDVLVNFCHQSIVSNMETSCVTVDGYGTGNLFAMDPHKRGKGMQVERFIRAPVSLNVTFKVPLCITHILIKIQLEHNDICKIDLSTSTSRSSCGFFKHSGDSPLILYNKLLNDQNGFVLPNKVIGSHLHAKVLRQEFSLHSLRLPSSSSGVIVNFSHWSGPKPLTIKNFEIWGTLSGSARSEDKKTFENFKESLFIHNDTTTIKMQTKLYNTTASSNEITVVNETVVDDKCEAKEIPTHFTDSLTHNIMSLPVLLPSGYYIDQSSVDKTIELDVMLGRTPSDPFTGIPYSHPPQFCPHLKADIDHYTSKHQLLLCDKTVGAATDIIRHRITSEGSTPFIIKSNGLKRKSALKRVDTLSQEGMQPVKKGKHDSIKDEGNVTPPPSGDIESSHLQERKDDHEIMIKSSLDDALNSLYPNH